MNDFLKNLLSFIGISPKETMVDRVNATADGFYDMYCDALTWHGRFYMAKILKGYHDGEIHPTTEVIILINHLLHTAPYQENALYN